MEKLPVKLLTELLTSDEIIAANNVKDTHKVKFCPVGITLPKESRIAQYRCNDKELSEFRYTPRAYFAVKVWEAARDNLLKRPEFAGVLDVEWYPVAASFNSVRFVNDGIEKFVAAMREEMKRLADSNTIKVRYGRFDAPALPELPNSPRRYYIMPQDIMMQKRGYGMKDELAPLQDSPAGDFSWMDIEDAFVVLKPIQLAFIAGEKMNRHSPLDEEFINACGDFDLRKVKELVAQGANIHAADCDGETAMDTMVMNYYDLNDVDENNRFCYNNKNHDRFIEIARYLLSLGYNINLAGFGNSTCLYYAPHIKDMTIMKFLFDNGADPNVGSYIGDYGEVLGQTVLMHVWEDESVYDAENFDDLELFLLSYGALPIPAGERITPDELDDWIENRITKNEWDNSNCIGLSKLDGALVNCAMEINFYYMALIAQSGGNINIRDAHGRNLLQILLEKAELTEKNRRYFKMGLAQMALMLLCGLKLKLSAAEIEQAKATCREKGYAEALDAIASVTAPK